MNEITFNHALSFIESWLSFKSRSLRFPGFAAAVSRNGKLRFNRAFGTANLETGEKLRPDHIFRVASHSKMFTATAVVKLAQEGKLDLDDPAGKFLSWLKKHKDSRVKNVTLRQLLSHSAGIIRDGATNNFWQLLEPFPGKAELKRRILAASLVYDANVTMKYSNFGYCMLGMVIEAATGMSFHEFVKKEIISPLKLEDTGPEYTPEILPRCVTGYAPPDAGSMRAAAPQLNTYAMAPATGVYSTTKDILSFLAAHRMGSRILLEDALKREMQRKHWEVPLFSGKKHYGLGFMVNELSGRRIIGHSGGFPGQRTRSFFDPQSGIAVSVLTNSIDSEVEFILDGIFQVFFAFEKYHGNGGRIDTRYEGQFFSFWGASNIISFPNDRLVCVNPGVWSPFDAVQELEPAGKNSFKITAADGYSSPGEPVLFFFMKGKVSRVRYAGSDIFPEALH